MGEKKRATQEKNLHYHAREIPIGGIRDELRYNIVFDNCQDYVDNVIGLANDLAKKNNDNLIIE